MPRSRTTPTVTAYFKALQKIFQLESEVLTGAIPHLGERGRNDEERFRQFLSRVLPRKYSVGTGFVVCSDPSVRISSQTDVVLADEVFNTPLHRELSAFIYPIETVYATIEVKGRLERRDLNKICVDIATVRELARHRWYVTYESEPKSRKAPQKRIVRVREQRADGWPAPRSFVFAYSQKGWQTADQLRDALQATAQKHPRAHIHGLGVLEKDWFFSQEAFEEPARFSVMQGDALMTFFRELLQCISSLGMKEMSVNRYLNQRKPGA